MQGEIDALQNRFDTLKYGDIFYRYFIFLTIITHEGIGEEGEEDQVHLDQVHQKHQTKKWRR